MFFAIVLNIPKFLEPKWEWKEINSTMYENATFNGTLKSDNHTQVEVEYEIGMLFNHRSNNIFL